MLNDPIAINILDGIITRPDGDVTLYGGTRLSHNRVNKISSRASDAFDSIAVGWIDNLKNKEEYANYIDICSNKRVSNQKSASRFDTDTFRSPLFSLEVDLNTLWLQAQRGDPLDTALTERNLIVHHHPYPDLVI